MIAAVPAITVINHSIARHHGIVAAHIAPSVESHESAMVMVMAVVMMAAPPTIPVIVAETTFIIKVVPCPQPLPHIDHNKLFKNL